GTAGQDTTVSALLEGTRQGTHDEVVGRLSTVARLSERGQGRRPRSLGIFLVPPTQGVVSFRAGGSIAAVPPSHRRARPGRCRRAKYGSAAHPRRLCDAFTRCDAFAFSEAHRPDGVFGLAARRGRSIA